MTRRTLLLGVAALLGLAGVSRPAQAIPAFARKYHVSCLVCHAPVPRLNTTGERFAANGFAFAKGEEPRDTIATGDPLLRLQNSLPLAVRFDGFATALTRRAPGEVAADWQAPWVIKLLSGGRISDRVSYYMYFLATEAGEVGGLEDAYLQFREVGGLPVDLIAGQFQVSDPVFKRELRLTAEDYRLYSLRVGDSRPNLTYDRGIMALASPWEGADVAFEAVAGQGLTGVSDAEQFDRDNFVNPVLRVSQAMGPMRFGAFGYYGSERAGGSDNRTLVYGPDASLLVDGMAQLNLQFLRRIDNDPFFGTCTAADPCPGGATLPYSTTVDAAMAEVVVWPQGEAGRFFATGLFNWVEANRPVVSLGVGEQLAGEGFLSRYRAAAVGAHWMLARNVRLMGETNWDFDRERARFTAGVIAAF